MCVPDLFPTYRPSRFPKVALPNGGFFIISPTKLAFDGFNT